MNALPSLLYLSLANCGMKDSYGIRIGDLFRPRRLLEINLTGNEFAEQACVFIGNALSLYYFKCNFLAWIISLYIAENHSLAYVNLSWNCIRNVASVALFRGVEVNLYLTELDLSWSNLSYDGSVALRRVLIVNKVLERLNISNCNVEWESAKLLGEGLAKNSTLTVLNVWKLNDYFYVKILVFIYFFIY